MANLEKRKDRVPVGADTESIRSRRIPLLDPRDRLAFPKDPAWHRVWVTDNGRGQVEDYMDSGFTFCDKKDIGWVGEHHIEDGESLDTRVSVQVGRAGAKENALAYLMQMPMEEWKMLKQAIADERSRPIKEIQESASAMKDQGYYGKGIQLK